MSWAPREGEDRRKDCARSQARAQRLRCDQTTSEQRAWKLLRTLNREGANLRRQAHVGQYVFDFADLSRRVLIELDGGVHKLRAVRDADHKKTMDAIARGYHVLRIANDDVWNSPDGALDQVRVAVFGRPPPTGGRVGRGGVQNETRPPRDDRPLPLPPPQGEGGR